MSDCYNEETNNCDGRCQGASDCPMAQGLNPSKRVMKLYRKKVKEDNEFWDKFIEECHQDPEYIKQMEELMNKFNSR